MNRKPGLPSDSVILRAIFLLTLLRWCAAAEADSSVNNLPQVDVFGAQISVAAPSEAVGDQGSPQSVVIADAIRQLALPTGDFGTVANLTPSYVSSSPNGPGFDAAKNQSLRGFIDGQFNVTMDGIPFADPDNFGHHTTSYFPVTMLDHLVVDRSPGSAGDLGYASFGGAINLYSEALPDRAAARLYASYGSFVTDLYGVTFNSAAPHAPGDTGALVAAQHAQSDGAMSNSPGYKEDILLKMESLVGDARLTALYTYDSYHFYNAGSITTTDLALYGPSYGYNTDPSSPNYYGNSSTNRSADFGYLKLQDSLGGWPLAETLYGYSYRNSGLGLKGDQTSSAIGPGSEGTAPSDIAGRSTREHYRIIGNDARIRHQDPYGALLLGFWAEHGWQSEARTGLDLTTRLPYDVNKKQGSPVYFDFDAHIDTVQPYAEYSWQLTEVWKLDAGVRYRSVTRDFEAAVIPNFLPGNDASRTVRSTLPSLDTSYKLGNHSNIYVQVSKGALVPSQSFFYTAHPAAGNLAEPETTVATQLGVASRSARYGVAADVYNITFNNYVSTISQNGDILYVNAGRVRYRGLEAEGHLDLGGGFHAVVNASLLRAAFQDSSITSSIQRAGDTIPFAPAYTGLIGLLYGQGRWSASLLSKFVGREYQGKNGSADGSAYQVNAHSYTDLTVTHVFGPMLNLPNMRLTFSINNLWNSEAITDNAGPSIAGPDLVNVLPRRNYMLSAVVDL